MGDRANVYVKDESGKGGVYLYTHWGGTDLPLIVQAALKQKKRWGDAPYLARIIFCQMVGQSDFAGEHGYGISIHMCDNEHPIIVVDCDAETVGFAHEGKGPECYQTWPFSEYIALKEGDVLGLYAQ